MNGQSERVKGRRFLAENKSSWKIPTVRRWSYFGRPHNSNQECGKTAGWIETHEAFIA
jgi:hypothetical protein